MKTSQSKSLFEIFSVIAALVLISMALPAHAADGKEDQIPDIVARKDYNIGKNWQPRQIMGKDFWLIRPYVKSWDGIPIRELKDHPLFKESGLDYIGIPSLTLPNSSKVSISAMNPAYLSLIETRPSAPFFIMPGCIRGIKNSTRFFEHDMESYNAWKKSHPNFMGCTNAETDNGFLASHPEMWGGARLKADLEKAGDKELLEAIVREFPKPKSREEMTLQMLKVCERSVKYFFNDTDKVGYMAESHCLDHIYCEASSGVVIRETTNTCGGEDGPHYRHQVGLAFTRGAARQYYRNWEWYIAFFYNGYDDKGTFSGNNYPNYLIDKEKPSDQVGGFFGPGYGMSPSLLTRDMFLAYLSGASFVENELWPHYLHAATKDGQPTWDLSSPLGKAWENWFEFTRKNPDRGVSYAPVALLVPFEQGYPVYGGKSWGMFNYERPDWMIDAFMFTIMPHSPVTKKGDEGALANSPYGDIYDVIVPNTPAKPVALDVLNNYKAAVMLGKYAESKALAERLMEYVKIGGTLLLNINQVNDFFPAAFLGLERTPSSAGASDKFAVEVEGPVRSLSDGKTFELTDQYEMESVKLKGAIPLLEDAAGNVLACKNKFGKGNVIVSTVDCLVPKAGASATVWPKMVYDKKLPFVEYLLKNIVSEVLPLEVKGDIEYGLNKLSDGWLLYLINNKGVRKLTNKDQTLDMTKTAKVEVALRNIQATEITELREQHSIRSRQSKLSKLLGKLRSILRPDNKHNSFTVDVLPGEVRVAKITTAN